MPAISIMIGLPSGSPTTERRRGLVAGGLPSDCDLLRVTLTALPGSAPGRNLSGSLTGTTATILLPNPRKGILMMDELLAGLNVAWMNATCSWRSSVA